MSKRKRKKLVTADDYRMDRDYWKKRVRKQQRIIDAINRDNDRLENALYAKTQALEDFRKDLREVCPHDRVNSTHFHGKLYCFRCNDFLTDEETKKYNASHPSD